MLIEFARTSDDTINFHGMRRAIKELKYYPLHNALQQLYPTARIHLCPPILGTRASVPEQDWQHTLRSAFTTDTLPPRILTKLYRAATRGAVIALANTWSARLAAIAETRTNPAESPSPPDRDPDSAHPRAALRGQ